MAAKPSTSSRLERTQPRKAQPHLSPFQKSLLRWLRHELRQRAQQGNAPGVPYAELVRAFAAVKTSLRNSLRYLMQKDLLTTLLPRGSWTRYMALTDAGKDCAKTLTKEGQKKPRR